VNYGLSQDRLEGPHGRAFRVALPVRADTAETVCYWVITSPWWHPLWAQYSLGVVRLRPGVPGFPDPVLKFEGATHELIVVALNPEFGPWNERKVVEADYALPYLEPVNIAEQFTATDDEMAMLAGLCVLGVLTGHLNPETSDAPTAIREAWLTSMVRTLAHLRGEEHAP
jgi:hypothetical protein